MSINDLINGALRLGGCGENADLPECSKKLFSLRFDSLFVGVVLIIIYLEPCGRSSRQQLEILHLSLIRISLQTLNTSLAQRKSGVVASANFLPPEGKFQSCLWSGRLTQDLALLLATACLILQLPITEALINPTLINTRQWRPAVLPYRIQSREI